MTKTLETKTITAPPCPICGKPMVTQHRPFCSKRCADVDLARWLGGRYVIGGTNDPDNDPNAGVSSDVDGSRRSTNEHDD